MNFESLPIKSYRLRKKEDPFLYTVFSEPYLTLPKEHKRIRGQMEDSCRFCFTGEINYIFPACNVPEAGEVPIRARSFYSCRMEGGGFWEGKDFPAFLLFYAVRGNGTLRYGGTTVAVSQGAGCFLDCREPHRFEPDGQDWEFTVLMFEGKLAQQLYQAAAQRSVLFDSAQFPDFESRQQIILSKFAGEGEKSLFDLSCHLDHLLTKILLAAYPSENAADPDGNTAMMQIISYMHGHFHEDIRVEQIAEKFHFSPSHFRRKFREEMGVSPKEYLSWLRIGQAKKMLKRTDRSVQEIAAASGFRTPDGFIGAFKKQEGMTPLQFRKLSPGSAGGSV